MKKAFTTLFIVLFIAGLMAGCSSNDSNTALKKYTVSYDGNTNNGGDPPIDTETYASTFEVVVKDKGTLSKTGYTFAGWNTQADGNGTDRAPGSNFAMGSANVILYAKWTANPTYTVTYNANTGTGGVPADSNNYLPGATVTVLGNASLTKTGYTFAGWNTQADGNGTDRAPGSTFAMGSANVILYAKWTANPTYTVTYNANTGTGGVPADSNNYLPGATVTVLGNATLTKAGYTFAGWNTQADGNGIDRAPGSTFAIGSANVILYAKWTANPTYTVTYNANTGTGGVPADSNNYLPGATVTVLGSGTLTKTGYTFAGWNTQADGSGTDRAPSSTFAMGSADVTLYAQWTRYTPFLETAASFAVLAGSTVTNTGDTNVTGNIGVWPGLAITGFPPGVVVSGTIHLGGAVAQQAQNDLTTAYNSLAGRACDTDLTGQDLGGLTLAPGVYCFNTSAQLTGNLKLDAQGDPNALFVFQIPSAFTTASSSSVTLINGAWSDNVFWQVGSSATLGTNTAFSGNIIALTSITLNTSATIDGRALARNGAVTLDFNTITLPVP